MDACSETNDWVWEGSAYRCESDWGQEMTCMCPCVGLSRSWVDTKLERVTRAVGVGKCERIPGGYWIIEQRSKRGGGTRRDEMSGVEDECVGKKGSCSQLT